MRKLLSLLLIGCLCVLFVGCQPASTDTDTDSDTTTVTSTATTDTTAAITATATDVTARLSDGSVDARRIAAVESDFAVDVLIEADGTVTDLCLLTLQLSSMDHAMYTVTDSMTLGELYPDAPLIVTVDFPGDLSAWGLSFTDADGQTQYRTMAISGEDGSLMLIDGIA